MADIAAQLDSLLAACQIFEELLTLLFAGGREEVLRGVLQGYGNADSAREDFINDVRRFDAIMQQLLEDDDNGGVFINDNGINRHQSMGLREDLMRQVFGLGGGEEKPHKRRYESFKKRRAIDDSKWRMDPRLRLRKQPTWRYG